MTLIGFLTSALLLGLVSAGIALSVAISLRFLHFPDLTIDGTLATSGAAFAITLVATGSSALAFLAAIGIGFACGIVTMFLHQRFGIGSLLSGILVFTALYSIDLRLMGGSNVSILGQESWLDRTEAMQVAYLPTWAAGAGLLKLAVLIILVVTLTLALARFFQSRPGIIIRAIGDNERAITRLAIPAGRFKYLGLGLANAVAGLSAALLVSLQGFADVGMGAGSLVLGLAALIIGEKLVGRLAAGKSVVVGVLFAALIGMFIYQAIWLLVLRLGLAPTDLKLFTALLVVVSFVWGRGGKVFYEGRAF